MNVSWDDARIFLAVATTGSFSAAGRQLGIGQPTVSRRVAQLEEDLGGPLFYRTVEGAGLTALGTQLLPAAEQMERWAAEWQRLAAGKAEAPAGRVRIAAPPGVAWDFLVPFAARLRQQHPQIHIEVLAVIEYLDLSRGHADIALRSRAPTAPDLVSLLEVSFPLGVFAAPSYACRLPARPQVKELDWICWAGAYQHLPPRPQLEALIPDFVPAFASDNYIVQQHALVAGLGVMILPHFFHPDSRLRKSVVSVPVDLELPTEPGHLVCARSALHIPRVRVVAELLAEALDVIG